jgi:ribosomal protein S18 acetylase RimI-like enzyme
VAAGASIACGEAEGYLAKAGDPRETVGWLHAAPRHKLPHGFERMRVEPPEVDVPPQEAAIIVCFVIAPAWRRRGVATALLDAALVDLGARGIAVVDAFLSSPATACRPPTTTMARSRCSRRAASSRSAGTTT